MRVSLPFVFVFAALLPFAQGDNPFWDSWGHLSYLDEKRQTKSVLGFRFLNGGPGHMGVIRDFKEVTPEFNLRGYMIKVDRGIYTELVHRDVPYESKLKSVIEGDEAREYLVGFYKKMAEKNPSSHTFADFEAVQRLMTPKILVPSIIEQVQQPEKYKDFNATSDIDTPKNNPPMFVKIRSYAFNVSNDNAKQYTEKPQHCNLFMYSSSKGSIKLGDMRQAALCDHHSKVFEEEEDPSNKSFFSEIISSISDVKFSRDGRFILSRDYMTLKIWDVNMESRPVKTIQIHENLRSKLGDLYENDFIFDKFECCFSGDGNYVLTGSYHNLFHVYDRSGRSDCCIEASKVPPKKKPTTKSKLGIGRSKKDVKARDDLISVDQMDFNKKALHLSWHPTQNIVVVAALNHLYLYSA